MSSESTQRAAGGNPFAHDASVEALATPLWREWRWPLEWLRLRMSAAYCGRGIPHGEGEPVLLVPGFLAGDHVMMEMHRWLWRIGYAPHRSGIVWNTDCPDHTAQELARRVERIHGESGHPVRVIGHSLGGMLAKSLVQLVPRSIDRIITMGSPFRDLVRAHPAVVGLWDHLKAGQSSAVGRNLRASCGTGHCLCPFVRHLLDPEASDVPQFAVFSKRDGVVHWEGCIEDDAARNTEVHCTHIGMAFDAETYTVVAKRLAEAI